MFELFYHRHKITEAFINSRRNYDLLNQVYAEVEPKIETLETMIAELTQIKLPTDVNPHKNANTDRSLKYLKTQLKQLLQESFNYERALQCLEYRAIQLTFTLITTAQNCLKPAKNGK